MTASVPPIAWFTVTGTQDVFRTSSLTGKRRHSTFAPAISLQADSCSESHDQLLPHSSARLSGSGLYLHLGMTLGKNIGARDVSM
ncbi:unnamed protein product [Peniophora sp. CBMAI 1063]|nr:unnamed protein product [Peniophora sp. CBMAI 1063]